MKKLILLVAMTFAFSGCASSGNGIFGAGNVQDGIELYDSNGAVRGKVYHISNGRRGIYNHSIEMQEKSADGTVRHYKGNLNGIDEALSSTAGDSANKLLENIVKGAAVGAAGGAIAGNPGAGAALGAVGGAIADMVIPDPEEPEPTELQEILEGALEGNDSQ